ncbi:MAG: phenylacetate--CoA ligase [Armatimonadetes bacterium]|nr:phenylacetate--CoA ligase [Armatimonadota bacterium]
MIWNPYYECMDVEQRRELQLRRLRETVARLAVSVPYYREKFAQADVEPEAIQSVDDLRYLPFTTKEDLRDTYPFGLFATPLAEVVRVHASSGTTGNPTVVGYTKEDIALWAELVARCICCSGGSSHDILHVAYGYGLFTGGLGLHYGGELVGCTVIPMSGGNSLRQLKMMADLGSTILACTPSYALTLAEVAEQEGMDISQLKLKSGIFGAEPWSEGMRQNIEEKLGLSAHDIYGLSEIIGPGVSNECEAKDGLHVFDDHFIPEVIDPQTGEPLPPGERGELVITCITKRCLPVIRYRTRDITALNYDPCECGRTHARMARLMGRTDDMLIIRGVNVFPSQIEEVISHIPGLSPHYHIVVTREGSLDVLEVQVEVSPEVFSDTIKGLEELEQRIARELQATLSLTAKVRLVEPQTLARSEGKAKRVTDLREEV